MTAPINEAARPKPELPPEVRDLIVRHLAAALAKRWRRVYGTKPDAEDEDGAPAERDP